MSRLTPPRRSDWLWGLLSGVLLTVLPGAVFAAWYLDHLGFDAPVLWDGYGFWFAALAVSFAVAVRLRDRRPVYAGALLSGACAASLLLIITLWLLDNGVGFSA